jgi:hypothetical protein
MRQDRFVDWPVTCPRRGCREGLPRSDEDGGVSSVSGPCVWQFKGGVDGLQVSSLLREVIAEVYPVGLAEHVFAIDGCVETTAVVSYRLHAILETDPGSGRPASMIPGQEAGLGTHPASDGSLAVLSHPIHSSLNYVRAACLG